MRYIIIEWLIIEIEVLFDYCYWMRDLVIIVIEGLIAWLCLDVREWYSLYIHIYIFCEESFFIFTHRSTWYQVDQSNTNNSYMIIWFRVFLSNINNSYTILWFQVFLSNINNSYTILWFQVFLSNTNNSYTIIWFQIFLSNTNNSHKILWF